MSSGKCKLKQGETTTHLVQWPKARTLTKPHTGEDMEQQKLSFIAGRNVKWYRCFGRQVGSCLTKLNILLPYDPVVEFLGIYTELKTYPH